MKGLVPKIGVEIHAQLATKHKLFSNAKVDWRAVINSQVDPFDSATPGTMPRLNWECLGLAVRSALAFECRDFATNLQFDRKHYDYWDLPAGYQITQHRNPFALNGRVILDSGKIVKIKQIHIEQDSGKSFKTVQGSTLVDLNRAGVGLIELVSEPDMQSAKEASQFVQRVHEVLEDVRVCSGNLEEGAMRIDVNVNWTDEGGSKAVTPRVELKNINGIGVIEEAVSVELQRQQELLHSDPSALHSETRLYLAEFKRSDLLRGKQVSQNYRFLPEYDLPEYPLNPEFIQSIKAQMPLTRHQRIQQILTAASNLNRDHLLRLWSRSDVDLPKLFEDSLLGTKDARFLLNWCCNELLALLNRNPTIKIAFSPARFLALVEAVRTGQLDKELAKQELASALNEKRDITILSSAPLAEPETKNITCLNPELDVEIDRLFADHAGRVEFLKSPEGKSRGSVDFFVGPLMKKFRGRIKASELIDKLQDRLETK